MLTRRRFLGYSALVPAVVAYKPLLCKGDAQQKTFSGEPPVRLAILGNKYEYGSQLQSIADRFLVGYPFNGDWHVPNVQVVSMFIESKSTPSSPVQRTPHSAVTVARDWHPEVAQSVQPATPSGRSEAEEAHSGAPGDLSAGRSREFGFRLCANIPEALRCGGDHLAVDAVLTIVEDGNYLRNDLGQILYPRFDFFEQCRQVFEEEGKSVPYFNDSSLSFSFNQAKSMVQSADRLKIPLMAGSYMPTTWRLPDVDIPLGAHISEAVMVGNASFGGTDFDAIEAMQCMLERRRGGETGVKAVQLLEGDDVWAAAESGRWSKELLSSALSRSEAPLGLTVMDGRMQDMANSGVLPQLVPDPVAYCIEYADGTRATMLMITGADNDFTFSARVDGGELIATKFFRSPFPNLTQTAALTWHIEKLFSQRVAPFPVQRTLLAGGIVESGMLSRHRLNQRVETPHLAIKYEAPAHAQFART